MNQLMEQLVEGDRKINTTSSSAQKIVDEATHHRDQNLPNPDKFGLLTKTTRINNHIHVPADSDLCTLKYGGSNQPINARYCCSTPPLFKEVWFIPKPSYVLFRSERYIWQLMIRSSNDHLP